MRVTENTNYNTVRDSITRSKGRMENLQLQSSTLKRVNQPSDDPIGGAKILELRTDKVTNEQFQTSARMAEMFLNNTDHALEDLSNLILRAKEIAINQSSGPSSSDSTRLGVAEEVTQLYQQAVSTGNRRIGDRYLFGGYKNHVPPVNENGEYLGDEGQIMIEISKDVFVAMNVMGVDAFNTRPDLAKKTQEQEGYDSSDSHQRRGPASDLRDPATVTAENVNVFGVLRDLRISLLTGNMQGIQSTLDRLDDMHTKLVSLRAKVGSRVAGIQSTTQALERHNLTNASLNSALEDADMVQVMGDLAKEETVFRSSLQSSRRLIQPTLMDFLK